MAYLKQWFNGESVTLHELGDGPVVIGRHQMSDIVVEDPTVSSRHAEIQKMPAGYQIKDLGSTNGISIGQQKVSQYDLKEGVKFNLGMQAFEFLDKLPSNLDQTLKIKKSWVPGVFYTGKKDD